MPTTEEQAAIDAIKADLANIDKALAAGVSSYSVDGVTTTIDLNFLSRQRASLADRLAALEHPPIAAKPRALIQPVDLSRFAP
jgi:hypothetical protein